MEFDKKRIEDAIISEVSDNLVNEDDFTSKVKAAVDKRINELFKAKADAQIADAINEAIKNGFDREYCRMTSWGERDGAPTTIRKEMERLISGYWNATVDSNGKPSDSYGAKLTRAEWVMMQMVADDFKGNMKNHVLSVAGALKDGLRAQLHETVNKLLSEMFHVKSLDDQAREKIRG